MFDFLRPRSREMERKSASPLIALSLGGAARWSARDSIGLARIGVLGNSVAYARIRKIATAAASVPWLLYDGAEEVEAHPLLALLARPNPLEGGDTL